MPSYEVELPGVYFDDLITSGLAGLLGLGLINRNPEPDETGVPVDSDVTLTLVEGQGGGGPTFFSVHLNGVLAYSSAGGFAAGFDGPRSVLTWEDIATERTLVIDRVTDFASQALVVVDVVGTSNVVAGVRLETSYSFTIEDRTTPHLVTASATGLRTVRITWDEPMRRVDAAVAGDALNPASYAVTPLEVPAYTPTVIDVVAVNELVYELTFNAPLSPGVLYRLAASSVKDVAGNVVTAPFDAVNFTAFRPDEPAGRDFRLWDMLPLINRREDDAGTGDLRRFIGCYQEVIDLVLADVDGFADLLDPDVAPEAFVDAMLFDMGNPFAFELTLEQKRLLLSILVPLYKQKGTAPGVINAVRFFLGIEITIESFTSVGMVLGVSQLDLDWILGAGSLFDAYAFKVVVPRALTDDERRMLRALVEFMKRVGTHFALLEEPVPGAAGMSLGHSQLGVDWVLN